MISVLGGTVSTAAVCICAYIDDDDKVLVNKKSILKNTRAIFTWLGDTFITVLKRENYVLISPYKALVSLRIVWDN